MEQDNLNILKATLRELREKIIQDKEIRSMFLKHYPDLDYEEAVDRTIADLMQYALEKDYDVLSLSLKGAELFFATVLSNLEEDDEEYQEEKDEDNYGKA